MTSPSRSRCSPHPYQHLPWAMYTSSPTFSSPSHCLPHFFISLSYLTCLGTRELRQVGADSTQLFHHKTTDRQQLPLVRMLLHYLHWVQSDQLEYREDSQSFSYCGVEAEWLLAREEKRGEGWKGKRRMYFWFCSLYLVFMVSRHFLSMGSFFACFSCEANDFSLL